jgi:Mlc titration factor MtfA (ptsG expression regulator)
MFGFFRRRRRARLRAAPFPEAWRGILSKNVPLYERLPPDVRRELESHVQVLLAEKHFEASRGTAAWWCWRGTPPAREPAARMTVTT